MKTVFADTGYWISKRGSFLRQATITSIQSIRNNAMVEIVPQTGELFQAALDLYSQRLDQSWSHTDCASFCIMQQQSIQEALAYDRHFEQAGFVALLR